MNIPWKYIMVAIIIMSYATLLIGLIIWLINKKIKDYVKYRSGLTKSELDFETDIVFLDY